MKWTEALVVERLRAHYTAWDERYSQQGAHVMLTQVPAAGRVIDVLVHVNAPDMLIAIEVKVSRADYRSETDAKRDASWQIADRCLYAAPAGLIDPATLPRGWGLIEVSEDRDAELVEYGDESHATTIGDRFARAMIRRCAAAEDAIRYGDTPAAEVARLKVENDRMHGLLTTARDAVRREQRRTKQARSELLAHTGGQPVCADCLQPITWKLAGAQESQWVHIDAAHNEPCTKTRAEADRLRKEAATGAKYQWGFPTPIEPSVFRDQREAEERMESAS